MRARLRARACMREYVHASSSPSGAQVGDASPPRPARHFPPLPMMGLAVAAQVAEAEASLREASSFAREVEGSISELQASPPEPLARAPSNRRAEGCARPILPFGARVCCSGSRCQDSRYSAKTWLIL